jgi:two-component system, cell cycle sensor histidine kinase and response regulator CckA
LKPLATVLVVEDEPGVRGTCCRMLTELGYKAVEADRGALALELLERHNPIGQAAGPDKIDLVLTDVRMPEMNGDQLAERIRALPDAPPVLFMSGFLEDLARLEPFLPKPFGILRLGRAIAEVLELVE